MNITICAVGKVKEDFYRKAIAEYEKRLSRYCKFLVLEVADERTPDGITDLQIEKILQVEGERLHAKIPQGSYLIALDIRGKKMDSEGFAKHIEHLSLNSQPDICFVIGGSLGLSKSILQQADFRLSFSDMTFPHQLMRVILTEQIYRAFRIIRKEPYHK